MTWKEITTSDDYKSLPDDLRSDIKRTYFDSNIAPGLAGATREDVALAFQDWMETPDDTGEGLIRSALGSAARGFFDPLAAAPEVAGAYLGIEGLEEFGGDVRGAIEGAFPVNPAEQGLVTDAFSVLGQVGQVVATGGGGAVAGAKLLGRGATEAAKRQAMKFGATAAQQTAMGSSAVAGGLERAEQLGLEGGDRLLRGAIAGGTELVAERLGGFATELGGLGKAVGFADTVESGFMKPIIRGIGTEAGEEGLAEAAGQVTDIAMAPEAAPGMDLKNIGYAMLLGGVGGAAFGGIEAAITPRTKKAFEFADDFTPSTTPPPGMTRQEADDQDLLVYDNIGNVIGYRTPQAPVTAETIEAELPVEIAPAVAPLAQNVADTPEANATAAALRRIVVEDTESGLTDAGMADAKANLLTGMPMRGGSVIDLQGQRILEGQPAPVPAQAETVTPAPVAEEIITEQEDEQIPQETLQQEQGRGQELQEPRELPILPAEQAAQAPEAAVGRGEAAGASVEGIGTIPDAAAAAADQLGLQDQLQEAGSAAVDTQAALDTQGDGIVRDEGIVGADVELEQQKATLPVDGEGAMLQGGDVRQEETQQVSAPADVPTDSLPAGQLTSGDVGKQGGAKIPVDKRDTVYEKLLAKGKPAGRNMVSLDDSQVTAAIRKKLYSDRDAASGFPGRPQETDSFYLRPKSEVTGIPSDKGWILKDKRPDLLSRLQPQDATPPPQESPEPSGTSPTESLPATGQPTSGDVGVAAVSDVTNLENPDKTARSEYEKGIDGMPAPIVRNRRKLAKKYGFEWSYGTLGDQNEALLSPEEAWAANGKPGTLYSGAISKDTVFDNHQYAIANTLDERLPVNAKAVEAYNITLPDGYTLNEAGDLYVYAPNATPATTQEATQATTATPPQPETVADATEQPEVTQPAASTRLRDYIATLPAKAQAAWTPERLSAAESYYATGNESALDPLTATQRKVVKREGVSESDAAAYEAEQKRQFALRNPPAATDSQFLEDYNAYVNSLSDETLQQESESRDESTDVDGPSAISLELSNETESVEQLPDTASLDEVQQVAPVSLANAAAAAASAPSKAKWLEWMRSNLAHLMRFAEKIWKQATATIAVASSILSPSGTKVDVSNDITPQEYSVSELVAKPSTFGRIAPWVASQKPSIKVSQNNLDGYAAIDLPKISDQGGEVILNLSGIGETDMKFRKSPLEQAKEAAKEITGDTTMAVLPKRAAKHFLNKGSAEHVDSMAEMLYEQESTSPKIAKMLKDMGISESPDTFPWCATSASYALTRGGTPVSITSSRAFLKFGKATQNPQYGDVVVMWNNNPATGGKSGWGGHVGFYLGEVDGAIAILSGNVNDEVNVSLYSKDRVIGYREVSKLKNVASAVRYKKILRSADGSIRRTGVKSTPARAARNSYIGVIPGVENTWLGTVEEFDAEFPDGYPFDSKTTTPPADTEALVAEDGRAFIFIDRVQVLDGDAERAEQHGTSPGVEAIKRLLRHESFIHRGYMALPGPLKNRFADFVASGIIPPEDLDYLVNNGYPHYKGWRDSKSTEMLAAEEWLAQRVERMGRIPQSGPIASIMDWLRDVWRWLTGGETTDLDKLRNTMRAMHKALGALDPKQRIVMELPDMDVLRRSVAQTQQDQEYLAAIAAGDMETAQRMVDEAARAAGFNITSWHGSNQPSANFSYYLAGRGGYRFFSNKEYAETYAGKDGTMRRSFLMTLKPFNIRNESGSKDYTAKEAADLLTSRGLDVSGIEFKEKSPLWSQMQSQGVKQSLEKAGFDSVVISETDDGDMTRMVFNPNQIKSADPVTYDSNGAPIPLSQRFQSTSSDIRYSKVQRPTIGAQVDALSFPGVGITSQENPMAFEREYGHLPAKYYKMAEKGQVADALQGYAKEAVAPYATSKEKLLELIEILRDDRKILDTFGIGATTGQAGLGYIYAEGALQAEKMGDRVLTEAFAFGRKAVGTSKGQGLVGEKFLVNDQRYQTLFAIGSVDSTRRNEQQAVVNAKVGKPTAAKVGAEFEGATETARDTVADAIPSELQISEKVLELGAAVQGNPTLTERVKKLISNVIDRGRKIRALQKLKSQTRASIIPDGGDFENMSEAELEAEIARLTKEIEADMDFIEKEVAKTPRTQAPKTPVETAKAIINRVQKQAAGETTRAKPKLDRVRLLHKAHLRERMAEADFMDEAKAAGLTPQVAQELYDAAELEIAAILLSKEVRGKSENYDKLTRERLKHLDVDSSALVEYINRLRREGKLGPVNWRDIMQLPPTRQQVIKGTLLELVKQNPQLQNLSAEEQQTLADALEKVWERERERQFKLQVKRLEMPGAKQEDQEKVVSATPRIIKLINQGMLAEDAFYKAVGEQFGIKEMSDADRKRIMELSEFIQDDTVVRADKAKEERELVSLLQKYHNLTTAEILSNVWVAHVLSGVRTQTDMALGFLNGLLNTVKKAGLVIYKNPNAKGAKTAAKGIQQFFVGLADGMAEAARYVRTEEPGLVRSDIEFINSYLEGGLKKGGLSTARKLRESDNKFLSALGSWLAILERVNTGWDVINYRATYQGTLAMAHALNPKIYKEALMPTAADFRAMEERAKTMLGANATRAQIKSRAFQYIEDGVHLLGKNLDESFMQEWKQMAADFNYDAKEAAMMVDPTGIGGLFYRGIMGLTEKAETKAKARADKAKEELLDPTLGRDQRFIRQVFPPLMHLLASQARNILGVRFIRFTGNKINELISYIPIAGMARIYLEEGMTRNNELTIKAMSVQMNQLIATAIMIPALIKAMLDLEDDDEERGYIIQGPWDNLTPERKSQLMADGFKPNTIAFYSKKTGRWTSWNYINWPSAGWFATAGSVSDYRRYTPEKWDEKTAAAKFMSGIYAGGSSFLDISSISQMTELFGRSTYSTDPATKGLEKVTKLATGYAGGFVPRIAKDVDSWFDKTVYKPEDTWGHIAKEMPFYRRNAGAPLRDIFYEPVQVSRTPWSRALQVSPDDPAYKALGRLNSRGIWLTPANPENRKVKRGGKLRDMTDEEANAYMAEVGKRYKEFVVKQGDRLLEMDVDRADELVSKYTARIREIAFKRAIATAGKAAIPSPE